MKIIPRKDTGLPIFPDSYYSGPYEKIGVCIHNMEVGTSNPITLERAKAITINNYQYHKSRWNAIDILEGYDLYNVNGEATILECRPHWSNCDAFSGMAKLGYKYIGIEVCGNFNVEEPNPVVVEGIIDFIVWLYREKKILGVDIKGHRDFNAYSNVGPTSCPGDKMYGKLEDIKKKVLKRILSDDKEVKEMLRYSSPISSVHHFPDVWTERFKGQWLHLQLVDNVPEFTVQVYATKAVGDGGFYKEIFKNTYRRGEKNPNPYVKFDLAALMIQNKMENSSISVHCFDPKGKPVNITCAIREF